MCGIYGYIGKNSVKHVLEGIKRLEYRGYDSAGVAFVDSKFKGTFDDSQSNVRKLSDGLSIIKEKGQIKILENLLSKFEIKSSIAIGHTRWATHGKPETCNSHPHFSSNGKWAIVHNGIIENYLELKKKLQGVTFTSETDSEVVAHLLEKEFNGDVLSTLQNVCTALQGSFAFAIIFSKEPDRIYVARRNSPVVVGVAKERGVVCSDLGSIKDVEEAYLLENDNFAVLEKGNVQIFDKNLKRIKLKNLFNNNNNSVISLGKHKHHMLKEIDEIPQAIENTVGYYNRFEKIKKSLPMTIAKKVKNILIIGCGTAYHAGLVGKQLFEELGIKSEAYIASEFRYGNYVAIPNTLAVFVSQSGETADTIKALELCKGMGIKTLAITNVKNSSICFEADYCFYTYAGPEIGVASTKAYDCQLAMFYLLASYFDEIKNGNENKVRKEARALLECAQLVKSNRNKRLCQSIARKIANCQSIFMLGRGLDYSIAQEASLKLKEVSYIHCEAYASGELKHGTISLIDERKYVFAFVTQQKLRQKALSNIAEVISREGKVLVFTNNEEKIKGVEKTIKLPAFEERFAPIVTLHYMQLISYYTSVYLGHNPDKPRSLAKSVTVE